MSRSKPIISLKISPSGCIAHTNSEFAVNFEIQLVDWHTHTHTHTHKHTHTHTHTDYFGTYTSRQEFFRRAWASPTLIMTTATTCGTMVWQYLSFTTHPGSRDLYMPWNALFSLVYWCGSYTWFSKHLNSMQGPELAELLVCCEECQWRQVHVGKCTDTRYKQIEPTETVEP